MKWRKLPVQDFLLLSLLAVCGAGLLVYSRPVSGAVTHAMQLCTGVLLPSLFPFLVLSTFLISTGIITVVTRLFDRPMYCLFGLPGCSSTAFFLGAIGGYPVGARTVSELYRQGLYSRKEAEQTLLFCNNIGPAFLIGVIGSTLLNDGFLGLKLYLIHLFSALLIGFLSRKKPCNPDCLQETMVLKRSNSPVLPAFLQAVTKSFEVFLNICAFVLLFAVLTCLLQQSGLIPFMTNYLPGEAILWEGMLFGTLEITSGVDLLVKSSASRHIVLPALSFLCAWGGLSVQMQTISLLQDANLPAKRYLIAKLVQGFFAAILTVVLC